jgi:hypothetical protein
VDVLVAVPAALQPHEAPVGEELHRLVVVVVVRRRQTIVGLLRGGDSKGEGAARAEQVFVGRAGRLRLGTTAKAAEAGYFKVTTASGSGLTRVGAVALGLLPTDMWVHCWARIRGR